MPPQPALYVKKEIFQKIGSFRLDMGTAADYEWMLRAIHVPHIKLYYLPEILAKMRVGGMSNKNLEARKTTFYYDLKAWELNGYRKNYTSVILKKLRKLPQFLTI